LDSWTAAAVVTLFAMSSTSLRYVRSISGNSRNKDVVWILLLMILVNTVTVYSGKTLFVLYMRVSLKVHTMRTV